MTGYEGSFEAHVAGPSRDELRDHLAGLVPSEVGDRGGTVLGGALWFRIHASGSADYPWHVELEPASAEVEQAVLRRAHAHFRTRGWKVLGPDLA